ncbi:hypothetical protein EJ110_NYTH59756 [Nymphaea thermarum]|nr:hypothetical protein EJ110_NYTH59756 [Nymphaea thermarum]
MGSAWSRGRSRGGSGKGRVQCTFCGKQGHLEDRCWDKHRHLASTSMSNKATAKAATPVTKAVFSLSTESITLSSAKATTKVRSFVCRCRCRRRWSFCAATVAAAVAALFCAVARSAPSLRCSRRPPPPPCQCRCLLHAVRCPVFLLLPCGASVLVLVMAEEIAPKSDVALDAGIAPKSETLPFQVTPIRLTKDNYLSWSAELEIGITSRGRLPYITGDKPAPSKTDPQWANWALEDSQVKVWIISSVSADIQPLILRKPTSFEMWNVLAMMYGRKKRVSRTYQIKRSIYALKQGDLSVASYYAALKTKWEELDYHVEDNWDCGSDHARHWEKEWMDRTFLLLGGLRDEFESIRNQMLNCDEIPGIEDLLVTDSREQDVVHNELDLYDTCFQDMGESGVVRARTTMRLGLFILRRDLFVVALRLVGEVLLCRTQISVTLVLLAERVGSRSRPGPEPLTLERARLRLPSLVFPSSPPFPPFVCYDRSFVNSRAEGEAAATVTEGGAAATATEVAAAAAATLWPDRVRVQTRTRPSRVRSPTRGLLPRLFPFSFVVHPRVWYRRSEEGGAAVGTATAVAGVATVAAEEASAAPAVVLR